MNISINTLYYPNIDPRIIEGHMRVMKHFGIGVTYYNEYLEHGKWMDAVMTAKSDYDVVGFLDVDCIPLQKTSVDMCAKYAKDNESFVGVAQASNHINNGKHVFAAPSALFISPKAWWKLGKPSMMPTARGDVAEELTFMAEEKGLRHHIIMPTSCQITKWHLHNLGTYGIGTNYGGWFYHLFQARGGQHVDLFERACNEATV